MKKGTERSKCDCILLFCEIVKYVTIFCICIKCSVRVYVVIISEYATKIFGTQNRQVACIHGIKAPKQSTFSKSKPAQ